ncbi:MAG: DNA primase [Candidatus Vogelbacteria bacterium]|nr:DNA primase [Candidatus Vogelbacteria bacterium]
MSSTIEQIKARLSVVEVVSSYFKLERAGANYRARCPFHQEKTPSFFVSPSRGRYHCFGCNRGGDLIAFVEEIENLDFVGALKLLAERAGVPYSQPNPALASLKDRLYLLHEAAAGYYSEQLKANPAALNYLTERGLTAAAIKSFRLGFSPPGWRNLGPALGRQGFKESELIQGGLLVAAGQSASANGGRRIYDRFRSRIMFPLTDTVGRVVGFSGRIFSPSIRHGELGAGETPAKYLNSSETPLYDKSKILYLYDKARLPMRTANRCILVEGQIDAILSHQAGLAETVAVSGTALTTDHLSLIKRLTDNLIMAFDADLAGVNAGRRAIGLALTAGLEVKIAILPAERDPADLICENPAAWRQAVGDAVHVIDFLLTVLERSALERRAFAHAVEREVYPFITRLANPLDQAFFIDQIATRLGLPEAVIRDGVGKVRFDQNEEKNGAGQPIRGSPRPTARRARLEEIIFGLVIWQASENLKQLVSERLGQERFAAICQVLTPRRAELALAAELAYSQSERLESELDDLLNYWQEETWREELATLLAKVKQLNGSPAATIQPYLIKCQELSEKINDLKKS